MFVNNLFGEYLCVLRSFCIRSHRLTFLYTLTAILSGIFSLLPNYAQNKTAHVHFRVIILSSQFKKHRKITVFHQFLSGVWERIAKVSKVLPLLFSIIFFWQGWNEEASAVRLCWKHFCHPSQGKIWTFWSHMQLDKCVVEVDVGLCLKMPNIYLRPAEA